MTAYLAISTILLAASFDKLHISPVPIIAGLAATFVSTVVLHRLIKAAEPGSIATFRRVSAMVLAGTLLWLFAVGADLIYAPFKSIQNLTTITFGAFLVCAFELVVINGAFL